MPAYLSKYVGSKLWLVSSMPDRLPQPNGNAAVALPFVGGGSVAAHYGALGRKVIASDVNQYLIRAHSCVRSRVENVIGELELLVEEWRKALKDAAPAERDAAGRIFFEEQRDKFGVPRNHALSETHAARFLFIVRAGFNGLWRENSDGECNVAYGKPEPTRDLVDAEGLRAYSQAVQNVEFLCEDFAVTLARANYGWAAYVDPPYSGTFTGYCGGDWEDKPPRLPGMEWPTDRERLAEMLTYLDRIGARWTASDADTRTARRLFGRWHLESVSRKGTVSCDGGGREDQPEILVRNWQSPEARAA